LICNSAHATGSNYGMVFASYYTVVEYVQPITATAAAAISAVSTALLNSGRGSRPTATAAAAAKQEKIDPDSPGKNNFCGRHEIQDCPDRGLKIRKNNFCTCASLHGYRLVWRAQQFPVFGCWLQCV
jgi:hypothetical protein